jgi:hypothetical protein
MQPILCAVLLSIPLSACQPKQVEADRTHCNQLKVGMSRDDVVAVMGRPGAQNLSNIRGQNHLFLYYSEPRLASGPITVQFVDSGSGFHVDYLECSGQD